MKFKWWSGISAIFLTYWGLEKGYIAVRDSIRGTIENYGLYHWDIVSILLLLGIFLIVSLPYILPSIPMWYYGFKKK